MTRQGVRRLMSSLAVISLCIAFTGCVRLFSAPDCDSECERANELQNTLDALMVLRPHGAIPEHFYEDEFIKQDSDFDPNAYFTVLDHLSMEPGYVLDYIYMADEMGGKPLIYARLADQPPFATSEAYWSSENADYLAYVRVEDTPEGYLEFVALSVMGNQFYLDWHANYNDHRMISNTDGLNAALDDAGHFLSEEVPASLARKASRLDFTPTVTLTQDEAIVRVVTFTKWGGFSQVTYTISRIFPHTFIDWDAQTLLEYDCGLMF